MVDIHPVKENGYFIVLHFIVKYNVFQLSFYSFNEAFMWYTNMNELYQGWCIIPDQLPSFHYNQLCSSAILYDDLVLGRLV